MAQLERKRYSGRFSGDQLLPVSGGDELQGQWRGHSLSRTNSDEEESHHKKSVLAKVKEKAKKWKSTLSKKKHSHDQNTPAWGVSLPDYEEDVEDPEYHGAPNMAHSYKETINRPHIPTPTPTPTLTLPTVTPNVETPRQQLIDSTAVTREEDSSSKTNSKTLTETVTGMLAPAYTMVAEATNMITAKIQGPKADGSSEQVWDKGVSVKEYLRNKLEPGDEERALSQVISEAISPKAVTETGEKEKGVIEKVKGAVSSLLRMEQPTPIPVSTNQPTVVHATTPNPRFTVSNDSYGGDRRC